MPEQSEQDTRSKLEIGLEIRRAVLGDAYVSRNVESTGHTRVWQEVATSFCWGDVWAREGLSRRDRSLLTIAMLTALNREAELRIHLAGAFRNGCTEQEVQETLIHTMPYCGLPAAVSAFRVFDELAESGGLPTAAERTSAE